MFDLKVRGTDKTIRSLAMFKNTSKTTISKELSVSAYKTRSEAMKETPVRDGILIKGYEVTTAPLFSEVKNEVEYAAPVEFGVRARNRQGKFMLTHAFNNEVIQLRNRLYNMFRR